MRETVKRIALCIALAVPMMVISCRQQESVPRSSPLASPTHSSPLSTPVSNEPATKEPTSTSSPVPESAGPIAFPTSQPGLATVTGSLKRRGSEAGFHGMELYLSEVIETTDPDFPMVGINKSSDPKAVLEVNSGDFAFYDVPPGKYALAVTRPLLVPVLVNAPEEGGTLFLTLEADERVDLGTLPVTVPE